MKRLALLFTVGALWLLLAAVPVLADGGPHVASINNGSLGISADSCAGCHRAHTAQTENLTISDAPDMCLACHGAASTGATTDVEDGIQYAVATGGTRGSAVLGALRGGGFVNARIASADTYRLSYLAGGAVRNLSKVPVLATGESVTSTHMDIASPSEAIVWGNGASSTGAGGTTTLNCTNCHNPHGNGQYRILNPIPAMDGGTATASKADASVDDAPLPSPGDVRNYTVIQVKGTEGTASSFLLYASQVAGTYSSTAGDYFHRKVPWNGTSSSASMWDAPNGKPSSFDNQIDAWCLNCHTRYAQGSSNTADPIYTHQHVVDGTGHGLACTTCHVAHGSNAQMTGTYSRDFPWPGNAAPASGDSRLLKIDNRGTCQACHDPTGTVTAGDTEGPIPTPFLP